MRGESVTVEQSYEPHQSSHTDQYANEDENESEGHRTTENHDRAKNLVVEEIEEMVHRAKQSSRDVVA